jgi:GTP 3',8-cyclase
MTTKLATPLALPDFSDGLPIHVEQDRTLRVKIIDACGLTCNFCHNEGTPVAADRRGTAAAGSGSNRVSIYLATNQARFVPRRIEPDAAFRTALCRLKDAVDFHEVHLTGGEPTLHPRLAEHICIAGGLGLKVSITSNGENGARVLADCAAAGLSRINFSIFGTNAKELAQVQHQSFVIARAQAKIAALHQAIEQAGVHAIPARANIVVPNADHIERVHHLLSDFGPYLSIRLLNSLADGQESVDAITELLTRVGAEPVDHHLTAGASGWRTSYRLPNGRVMWRKLIRPLRLPQTCTGCRFNNPTDCNEGFYGLRLYQDSTGVFHVGICIQRMDLCLPLDDFIDSEVCREVQDLRRGEYAQLTASIQAGE